MLRSAGFLLALFLLSAPAKAQFNAYKYVVVPTHFEGYPKPNQYQTSTVIKYFLTENGYPAVYDAQQPTELRVQPCLGVFTRLHDTSGMFLTRVTLEFVDCEGKQVFQTLEGSSREKDYVQAYKEAIQNAFLSLSGRTYSYRPTAPASAGPALLPPAQAEPPAVTTPVPAAVAEPAAEAVPERVAESQPSAAMVAVEVPEEAMPEPAGVAGAVASEKDPEVWYAQPIENGYQLVDSFPSIRMKIIKTSVPNVYIALVPDPSNKLAPDTQKGMVYTKDGNWIHEYLEGGVQYQEPLKIKF